MKGIVEKPDIEFAPSEYVLCGRYIFPEIPEDNGNVPRIRFWDPQSIGFEPFIDNGGFAGGGPSWHTTQWKSFVLENRR